MNLTNSFCYQTIIIIKCFYFANCWSDLVVAICMISWTFYLRWQVGRSDTGGGRMFSFQWNECYHDGVYTGQHTFTFWNDHKNTTLRLQEEGRLYATKIQANLASESAMKNELLMSSLIGFILTPQHRKVSSELLGLILWLEAKLFCFQAKLGN